MYSQHKNSINIEYASAKVIIMTITKRNFLKASGASIAALAVGNQALASSNASTPITTSIDGLKNITTDVSAITVNERKARIEKAQSLMKKMDIAAIVLEPGAAMDYFSGVQWWRSERLTALVIPREGEVAIVCPFFEEPSIRETLAVGKDVRVWQEHESPFKQVQ